MAMLLMDEGDVYQEELVGCPREHENDVLFVLQN